MKGYFISVEGTDGSGKTTQIQKMVAYFQQQGYEVLCTREPGGTPIGESIRDILLNPSHTALCDRAEILLYAASRAQHLEEKILPAVKGGKIVISDRFADSTVAYQGFGRKLDANWVEEVNVSATNGVTPDLTIYLDVPPKQGILRKHLEEHHTLDRLEQETLEFHERVYEGYQALWKKYPKRIRRIDATLSVEKVFLQVKQELDTFLNIL